MGEAAGLLICLLEKLMRTCQRYLEVATSSGVTLHEPAVGDATQAHASLPDYKGFAFGYWSRCSEPSGRLPGPPGGADASGAHSEWSGLSVGMIDGDFRCRVKGRITISEAWSPPASMKAPDTPNSLSMNPEIPELQVVQRLDRDM